MAWFSSPRPAGLPDRARPGAVAGAAGGGGWFLGLTTLHLCFLPWALGGMPAWSQFVSLGLAAAGLVAAVATRAGEDALRSASTARRELRQFPIFWIGLALLLLIGLQGANPAWRFLRDETTWWLEPIPHVAWLPSGVDAPFARSNAWRTLLIGAAFWLLLCSLWIGLRRRRQIAILLTVLIANAGLLALLALLQRTTGSDRIFWSYLPSNRSFVASFIYPNHASAYFNLLTAVAFGLAWRSYQFSPDTPANRTRSRLLTSAVFLLGSAVLLSTSRAAIALLAAGATGLGLALAGGGRSDGGSGRGRTEFPLLCLSFALVLVTSFGLLGSERIRARFAPLLTDPGAAVQSRVVARTATLEMAQSRWMFGWGAGSFRHVFPLFARAHPAIYDTPAGGRQYWEHAHNELVQLPAELGLAGTAGAATAVAWAGFALARRRCWRHPVALPAALGAGLLLAHAGVDFVFRSPAVLLTWGAVIIATIRWLERESSLPASG